MLTLRRFVGLLLYSAVESLYEVDVADRWPEQLYGHMGCGCEAKFQSSGCRALGGRGFDTCYYIYTLHISYQQTVTVTVQARL